MPQSRYIKSAARKRAEVPRLGSLSARTPPASLPVDFSVGVSPPQTNLPAEDSPGGNLAPQARRQPCPRPRKTSLKFVGILS